MSGHGAKAKRRAWSLTRSMSEYAASLLSALKRRAVELREARRRARWLEAERDQLRREVQVLEHDKAMLKNELAFRSNRGRLFFHQLQRALRERADELFPLARGAHDPLADGCSYCGAPIVGEHYGKPVCVGCMQRCLVGDFRGPLPPR